MSKRRRSTAHKKAILYASVAGTYLVGYVALDGIREGWAAGFGGFTVLGIFLVLWLRAEYMERVYKKGPVMPGMRKFKHAMQALVQVPCIQRMQGVQNLSARDQFLMATLTGRPDDE